MAFRFAFNPTHRILRCDFSDTVTDEDLTYYYRMAALLAESLDPLAGLFDFSAVTPLKSSPEFMRGLAALPPVMPQLDRPRVLVAPADHVFGLARVFEIEGEATRPNFHVVRTMEEAWAILGVREPEFQPVPKALESRRGGSNADDKS
jgi:hypothetical protein